jgi:CDP-glucose 4,6-dehydratase
MRAWNEARAEEIRSPAATRPWQHVLEPLSGYLTLGARVKAEPNLHGEAYNFGPRSEQNHTVVELLADLARHWGFTSIDQAYKVTGQLPFHEASLLKLNCDKALLHMKWESTLRYEETTEMVASWYVAYYKHKADMQAVTLAHIARYESTAAERGRIWTKA